MNAHRIGRTQKILRQGAALIISGHKHHFFLDLIKIIIFL